MPFTIKHPATDLYWTPTSDSLIHLSPDGAEYEIDELGHIQNLETGLYVRHRGYIIREDPLGTPAYDFEWTIEDSGRIYNKLDGGYYVVQDGNFLKIVKTNDAPCWSMNSENKEDVPVSRAAALIEEALNASKKCGCECGCEAGCEGCACEGCDCPKPTPVEEPTPVEPTPVEEPTEA